MVTSAAICLILMFIGIFAGGALLHAIGTPTKIYDDSKLYLDIYVYGLPFVFFYNIATGIFSALGDSKRLSIFLLHPACKHRRRYPFCKGIQYGCCRCCMGNFPLPEYKLYTFAYCSLSSSQKSKTMRNITYSIKAFSYSSLLLQFQVFYSRASYQSVISLSRKSSMDLGQVKIAIFRRRQT